MKAADVEGMIASTSASLIQQSKQLVRRFLELTDPSMLNADSDQPLEDPITSWDTLYSTQKSADVFNSMITPSIVVRSHPSPDKHLFSVESVLPNIDARQFWTLMANSQNRILWDSTIELSTVQCWLADEITKEEGQAEKENLELASTARKLSARIELLRFGSIMFVASKRDMVLLCVDTQLPTKVGRLRLLSTSTSIEVASLPPKKGYNRFELNIGGFLVEGSADSSGSPKGIRVTQVCDLGSMTSYLPASIVRMVASSLVPKSMNVISKIAFKMKVPRALTIEGSGYGGEQDEEGVEGDLCESGGGSWQAQRHLSPVLCATDLLPFRADPGAEESRSESLLPSQSQSKSEGEVDFPTEINSSTSVEASMPVEDDAAESDQNGDSSIETEQSDVQMQRIDVLETPPDSPLSSTRQISVCMKDQGEGPAMPDEQEQQEDNYQDELGDESLASLFSSQESKDCTQMLSRHTQTLHRMSISQRETQRRVSMMLVSGSDSLAMAIAPGARESMIVVGRIMNLSIDRLEEESSHDTRAQETGSLGHRLGSTASTLAPPSMMTTPAERHAYTSDTMCSSTSSAITLCEEEKGSTAAWTSSLTDAPYMVAMGILNLASWIATRPLASSYNPSDDAIETQGKATETSRPTLSALGVTRQAYLQRDAVRIARPTSHYRIDDSKLKPFPLINDENLPPIGIARGHPTTKMHCDQAKEASLHQEPLLRQGWWAAYF